MQIADLTRTNSPLPISSPPAADLVGLQSKLLRMPSPPCWLAFGPSCEHQQTPDPNARAPIPAGHHSLNRDLPGARTLGHHLLAPLPQSDRCPRHEPAPRFLWCTTASIAVAWGFCCVTTGQTARKMPRERGRDSLVVESHGGCPGGRGILHLRGATSPGCCIVVCLYYQG